MPKSWQIGYISSGKTLLTNLVELRETLGKDEEAMTAVDESLVSTMDITVQLLFEKALIYQHLVMGGTEAENNLVNMGEAIRAAEKFIEENDLRRWRSRLARFEGRYLDYTANKIFLTGQKAEAKNRYIEAKSKYEQAIKEAKYDPEYPHNPARKAEYRAFAAFDAVMIEGPAALTASKILYDEFEDSQWGKELKHKDFQTWGIWRSGIFVRAAQAVEMLGLIEDNREMLVEWLGETQKMLTGEGFGFRKAELDKIQLWLGVKS